MSAPENFLARWSRLKRTTEAPSHEAAGPDAVAAKTATAEAEEPVVDLASLPSLDSIAADTDVSVFMKPGVPAALRDAAIRRAWAADPAIRDFRGLQENDWDFSNPSSVPGFGTFASHEEVARVARALLGAAADEPQQPVHKTEHVPAPDSAGHADVRIDKNQERASAAPVSAAQPEQQRQESAQESRHDIRRHGGALPK